LLDSSARRIFGAVEHQRDVEHDRPVNLHAAGRGPAALLRQLEKSM